MSAVRTTSEGLLEIFHPETNAYIPASVLLQVDGGLLASLVPDQVAMISDIRVASSYLQLVEAVLVDIRAELATSSEKVTQSNTLLNSLRSIDESLAIVKNAIDSLESLGGSANILLESVRSEIALLSGKIPATLGVKVRDSSLSVALASDSTIFASLTSILAALTADSTNSVSSLVAAVSAKLPASLGAKTRDASLSVALASDSTIFTSLTNILNALSDGGSNSALSYLGTVAGAQFWKAPTKFNTTLPVINAATVATSSAAYSINSQSTALSFQNFYSALNLSAQFAVELRVTAGATSLSDKQYYYRGDVASPFLASTGAYPGESPIVVPTHGYAQFLVHLSSISGGNVTTYAKEVR